MVPFLRAGHNLSLYNQVHSSSALLVTRLRASTNSCCIARLLATVLAVLMLITCEMTVQDHLYFSILCVRECMSIEHLSKSGVNKCNIHCIFFYQQFFQMLVMVKHDQNLTYDNTCIFPTVYRTTVIVRDSNAKIIGKGCLWIKVQNLLGFWMPYLIMIFCAENEMYGQVVLQENMSKKMGEVNLPKAVGKKVTFQQLRVRS